MGFYNGSKYNTLLARNTLIVLSLFALLLSTICQSYFVLILFLFVLSLACVIKVEKNYILTLIFLVILYCNYSIICMNYLDKTFYIFTSYQNTFVGFRALQILMSFMLFLYMFVPNNIKEFDDDNLYYKRNISVIIHIALMLVISMIIILGYSEVSFGSRGNYSPFYGYVVLLILVGLFFSNNKKFLKISYLILAILFIMKNLLHGERAYVIQLAFVIYIYFLPLKIKKNYLLIFVVAILGYLGMNFVSEARTYGVSTGSLKIALANSMKRMFSLDTACSSFFTSQTFVDMSFRDGFLQRIYMFVLWFSSLFVGGSLLPQSNLSEYTHQYITHWYGGVFPFYGYYYLDFCGVLIFALYISYFIKLINNNMEKGNFCTAMFIYGAVTILTWYLYSPSAITRGILLVILLYFAIVFADKVIQKVILWFRYGKRRE